MPLRLAAAALLLSTTIAAATTCTQEIGAAKAAVLVNRCIEVSPATHPPCNAQNACSLITDEIVRSCRLLGRSPETPNWCADYMR